MTVSIRAIAFLFWLSTTLILSTYVEALAITNVDAVNSISWLLGSIHGIAGYFTFAPRSKGGSR